MVVKAVRRRLETTGIWGGVKKMSKKDKAPGTREESKKGTVSDVSLAAGVPDGKTVSVLRTGLLNKSRVVPKTNQKKEPYALRVLERKKGGLTRH